MTSAPQTDWHVPREVAIPRLVDLHGGRLLALGRRICGEADEAEDLVQEIFVQAWRKWEQFDGRSDPIVWLYTIARRTCQRLHRKRAGEPAHMASFDELLPFGDREVAVVPLGEQDGVGEQVRREQREALEQAIAGLPDDFRMALILKDIVGFSIQEVAEVLDVLPATVKTRVHRARLLLRRALEGSLPRRELPPPAYSKQVCMDLLQAKQDSMDRGVAMPNADAIICDRCEAVFKTLDLTRDVCGRLADEALPEKLRKQLLVPVPAGE